MKKRITQWSYSRLKTYRTCPLKAKLNYIDHIKEPASPQMDRGSGIHKEAEVFVLERQNKVPDNLMSFEREFLALRRLGKKVVPERQWAFTKEWVPCEWTAPECWVRMVLDARYPMTKRKHKVIDYKTGKVYDDHKETMALYALGTFIMHPEVEEVEVELWYIDQGVTTKDSFKRTEMDDIKGHFVYETRPLLCDEQFAPRPGYYCKYCFYSKNKNGNCVY